MSQFSQNPNNSQHNPVITNTYHPFINTYHPFIIMDRPLTLTRGRVLRNPPVETVLPEFIPFITETVRAFSLEEHGNAACPICYEEDKPWEAFCQLNCNHIFCYTCIQTHKTRNDTCPLCREPITHIYTQPLK